MDRRLAVVLPIVTLALLVSSGEEGAPPAPSIEARGATIARSLPSRWRELFISPEESVAPSPETANGATTPTLFETTTARSRITTNPPRQRTLSKSARPAVTLEKLYPEAYRNLLATWRDAMVKAGHPEFADYRFETESEITAFLKGFTAWHRELGLISKEEEKALATSLATGAYHKTKEEERAAQALLPRLLGWLKEKFGTETAYAQLWVSAPQCYKAGGFASKGAALFAPTCNSGIGAEGVPLPDCGPGGVLCAVPLGCLNAVCKVSPNAIYERVTGICGCG